MLFYKGTTNYPIHNLERSLMMKIKRTLQSFIKKEHSRNKLLVRKHFYTIMNDRVCITNRFIRLEGIKI